MIDTNTYPALGFNFKVTSADAAMGGMVGFTFGVNSPGNDKLDSFQSVSGLGAKMDVDPLSNGGLNNINYKVPRKIQYDNLILKGGMLRKSSPLTKWCYRFLSQDSLLYTVNRKTVNVFLMDESDSENILMSWSFFDCFAVSVKMDEFDALQGQVAIQTLELSYSYFKFS